MEKKKTDRTNLEKKRVIFFQTGLVFSLAISLIAFEWTTQPKETLAYTGDNIDEYFEDEMINTFMKEEKKMVLPPEPEPLSFEIKDDSYEIENEMTNWENEYNPLETIEIDIYDGPDEKPEDDFFIRVEDMPEFSGGGLAEFSKYVNQHLNYPEIAVEHGIEGKVYVQFDVNEEGQVCNVNLLRSTDAVLDKEAMRVIKESPAWQPGKQRGVPVKVRFVLPVNFRLSN